MDGVHNCRLRPGGGARAIAAFTRQGAATCVRRQRAHRHRRLAQRRGQHRGRRNSRAAFSKQFGNHGPAGRNTLENTSNAAAANRA